MTTRDNMAKEASILRMLAGYPSLAGKVTRATIDAYLIAVEDFHPGAVEAGARACLKDRIKTDDGKTSYGPSAQGLSRAAAIYQTLYDNRRRDNYVSYPIGGQPPAPMVPLGPTSVDFGFGPIDMSQMTHAEKERVLESKGADHGRQVFSWRKIAEGKGGGDHEGT